MPNGTGDPRLADQSRSRRDRRQHLALPVAINELVCDEALALGERQGGESWVARVLLEHEVAFSPRPIGHACRVAIVNVRHARPSSSNLLVLVERTSTGLALSFV